MIYLFWNDGHAGLALTGLSEKNIYISIFAPVTMNGGVETSNGVGLRLHKLEWDFANTLFPYQQLGAIPTIESCQFGLLEAAIYDWWQKINGNQFEFSMTGNNCRSMVAQALLIGVEASSLSTSAKNHLMQQIEKNKYKNINVKEFISVITNDLTEINLYQKIFCLLNLIDESLDNLFVDGMFLQNLIMVQYKLEELKELSAKTSPELLRILFEIDLTIFEICQSFLTYFNLASEPSLQDAINAITNFKPDKASERNFSENNAEHRNQIQHCKNILSLRHTFWGKNAVSFDKHSALIKNISENVNSDNNPQKEFYRSRSTAISFVKL